MLDYISGKLTYKQPHRVVIEWNSVGVELMVPFTTSKDLPEIGQQVKLLCHLNWRQEEGPQLIGFSNDDERKVFKALIGVNKVGPKLALNIMSTTTPEALSTMILSEDYKKLTSLKGVGAKLASRLVVELKDVITKLGIGNKDFDSLQLADTRIIPFEEDVREALGNLGYSAKEISSCLTKVAKDLPENATIETTIGEVLRAFSS